MIPLNAAQQDVLTVLSRTYYKTVPVRLRTYCTVTAAITAHTLRRFDIPCEVVPCQLWYTRQGSSIVVGFVGAQPTPGKWDGHVVCLAGDWFVDAAVHQLNAEFGVEVPSLVFGRRLTVPGQPIARGDLDERQQLWWHRPPVPDPPVPAVPPALVERYGRALVTRVRQALARQDAGEPMHDTVDKATAPVVMPPKPPAPPA